MGNLDSLETPEFDFKRIIAKVNLGKPDIDLMATRKNRKARRYIDRKKDLFKTSLVGFRLSWCNAPHSIYKLVIPYLVNQYRKNPYNCIILIPVNNSRTQYWQELIEPNNIFWNRKGFAYWYPYDKPIRFKKNGRYLLNKKGRPEHAHNAYNVLIFLKPNKIIPFKKYVISWYN